MTIRTNLNVNYPSTYNWYDFMWEFYSFMTKISPNGPGWTSIGESNGTTGGMGTTGVITSSSSLSSSTAWYVLKSPDSKYQLLMSRESSTAYVGNARFSAGVFSRGSSSTLPTYVANNTISFTTNSRLYTSTPYNYKFNFIADDSPPYNFYAYAMYMSGSLPSCSGSIAFINCDGYDVNDGYPFVFLLSYNDGLISSSIDSSSTYFGIYSLSSVGDSPAMTSGCKLGLASNAIYVPGYGPPGTPQQNSNILLPVFFANSTRYKGVSTTWIRRNTNTSLYENDTVENKSWIRLGDYMLRWDGYTTPGK